MASKVTVPPTEEPVTLEAAKNHLKVDFSADDELIRSLISAAREVAEKYTNLKLLPQTIEQTFPCFPPSTQRNRFRSIQLAWSPIISVTSIASIDEEGNYQNVPTDTYGVNDIIQPPVIYTGLKKDWPTTPDHPEAAKITYQAGYADADSVPQGIKQAILLMVGMWYEKREDSVRKMPTQATWLLNRYRVLTFH